MQEKLRQQKQALSRKNKQSLVHCVFFRWRLLRPFAGGIGDGHTSICGCHIGNPQVRAFHCTQILLNLGIKHALLFQLSASMFRPEPPERCLTNFILPLTYIRGGIPLTDISGWGLQKFSEGS